MLVASALFASTTYHNYLTVNRRKENKMTKLSTGLRINSAADDAAGLGISEKMRARIRGQDMAARNIQDALSLVQTADGALSESHAILHRMRELAIQAGNDTYSPEDRENIAREVSKLIEELDHIMIGTEFNTQKLFLGADSDVINFQVGPGQDDILGLQIKKSLIPSYGYFGWDLGSIIIGIPGDDTLLDLSTGGNAGLLLQAVDNAIHDVSRERSNLGSISNRLEHIFNNVQYSMENLTAAESRIRDADMAKTIAEMVKDQILEQAATAMMAQANQAPKSLLQLLN